MRTDLPKNLKQDKKNRQDAISMNQNKVTCIIFGSFTLAKNSYYEKQKELNWTLTSFEIEKLDDKII